MLAPIPPRRITRSSTRNDSDTLCRCSGISCSENLPAKCMRWSTAMEPVTAMGTAFLVGWGGVLRPHRERPTTAYTPLHRAEPARPPDSGEQRPDSSGRGSRTRTAVGLAEGVAAGAGALRVGVVDREALPLDAVD